MDRFLLAFSLIAVVSLSCASGEDSDADYAARMAQEHEGDTPVPGAAAGDAAAGACAL